MILPDNFITSYNEFQSMKVRDKVQINCKYCNNSFYKNKRYVNEALQHKNYAQVECCSVQCLRAMNSRVIVNCKTCGKFLSKQKSQLSNNNFCSHSCSAIYSNKNRTSISKWVRSKCIVCKTPLSKSSQRYYCSNSCAQYYKRLVYIHEWKCGLQNGLKGCTVSHYIRRYIFDKYNHKCHECNWAQINPHTNKSTLEIHHIDGNWENCKEENLVLLCPNCHSLTSNYRANNKTGNAHPWTKANR